VPANRKPVTLDWALSQADCGAETDCWPWRGTYFSDGYGRIRNHHAHRVMWSLVHGYEPSPDLLVRHTCDNPPCVNPRHLVLGTSLDNNRDMVSRGRGRYPGYRGRGEANGNARLTQDQVAEIRRRYAAGGVRQVDLAAEFGVSQPMIGYIVRGEHWVDG
jgi:hypothetical protein